MRDLGLVTFDEPVTRLLNQGMVIKDGSAMSKSRGNVVDPDAMIDRFGADTTRVFSLFAAPPERDLEWSDHGVEGCHRFLERIWRIAATHFGAPGPGARASASSEREKALRRKVHQTILRVTEDLDRRLHFNTAVAALMELVNELSLFTQDGIRTDAERACVREALGALARLLSPFAPHFAEEVWERLGGEGRLSNLAWPEADVQAAEEPLLEVVIQVNGKLRGRVKIPKGTPENEILERARSDPRVEAHLKGRS